MPEKNAAPRAESPFNKTFRAHAQMPQVVRAPVTRSSTSSYVAQQNFALVLRLFRQVDEVHCNTAPRQQAYWTAIKSPPFPALGLH